MAEKPVNPHEQHRERMRRRIRENGFDSLLDHELLEYILYFAIPRGDTNPLAHRLLAEFGSISHVLDAEYDSLLRVEGVGPRTASLLMSFAPMLKRYSLSKMGTAPKLNTCERAVAYAKSLYIGADREVLYLLCLDVQCNLRRAAVLSIGTVDEAVIYPRNLVEQVLKFGAKNVILVHNHLSSSFSPSRSDVQMTKKVLVTLNAIDVNLLDHLIISDNGYYSFVQDGKINTVLEHGQVAYAADREV